MFAGKLEPTQMFSAGMFSAGVFSTNGSAPVHLMAGFSLVREGEEKHTFECAESAGLCCPVTWPRDAPLVTLPSRSAWPPCACVCVCVCVCVSVSVSVCVCVLCVVCGGEKLRR